MQAEPFQSCRVPLGGRPSEVAADLQEVVGWRDRIVRDAAEVGQPTYDVGMRRAWWPGRGSQRASARALRDVFDQAWLSSAWPMPSIASTTLSS